MADEQPLYRWIVFCQIPNPDLDYAPFTVTAPDAKTAAEKASCGQPPHGKAYVAKAADYELFYTSSAFGRIEATSAREVGARR